MVGGFLPQFEVVWSFSAIGVRRLSRPPAWYSRLGMDGRYETHFRPLNTCAAFILSVACRRPALAVGDGSNNTRSVMRRTGRSERFSLTAADITLTTAACGGNARSSAVSLCQ